MWAALCALLIVLSSNGSVASRSLPNSHAVNCVASLRSGGKDGLRENLDTDTTIPTVNRRATGRSMALLLPLIDERKRGRGSRKRAQDASDYTRAWTTNTRGKVSPKVPVSSTLASLIGAVIASGFTSWVWPEAVGASPFDPRPAPKSSREPFFEGWFIRLVDHEHRLSFAVILGSFRSQGGTELDQHYVSLSYLHNTDTSTSGANDLDEDLRGGNNGEEGALSSTSTPMKRFLEWARGRWLTMFSGFGAKGSNESWWGSRGDLGNNARAESSFEEPSSSKRKIGVNVDVDVHCISGGGMGPVDEVGENKAAPDREDMDLNDPLLHRDGEPSVTPLKEAPIEGTHTFHAFPPPETVTISTRGGAVDRVPNLRDESSFTWEADGIGYFKVDGDTGRLSFQLPELSVAASFRNRQPWSRKWPNSAGPEGWLSRTGLLPLHYYVHSLGSDAGYSLKAADSPRAVVGRGNIHMECNYGTCFPTGWIWAQGCSVTQGLCGNIFRDGEKVQGGNRRSYRGGNGAGGVENDVQKSNINEDSGAHFVLTGGRFVIGPATTNSFVLAFRSHRHHWDFRTTDLDRISVEVCRRENRVKIIARSWGDSRVLEADIHAPRDSFGSAIYVPTPEGFSNAPGCIESYAATAVFRLYTKDRERKRGSGERGLVLREEIGFKLAALEFGGSYQDT